MTSGLSRGFKVDSKKLTMQSVPKIVRDRLQAEPPAVHHPDADLLTAFAEQSLPAAERATVLEHLARCGDCRDVVALALPPTELLETALRPVRSVWLTWPVLRWGFVATGVVIVASIGVLQLQKHAESSNIATFNSPGSSPSAQVARNDAHPQLTVAPTSAPAAKPDMEGATPDRIDEARKGADVAAESKAAAPAAPPPLPPCTILPQRRQRCGGRSGWWPQTALAISKQLQRAATGVKRPASPGGKSAY